MTAAAGTDIERADTGALAPVTEEMEPAARRHMVALWKQAQRLARSHLVPDALRNKPDDVLAVVLFGEQYGLAPAHSVAQLWIIKGRIVPSSQVLAGVAMRAGHEIRIEETSSERCTIAIRRRGSDYWQRATWTIEDAKRAGLANKETWRLFPDDMLAHATMRRAVKRICPDVLLGIDDGGDDGRPVEDILTAAGVPANEERVVDIALDDDPDDEPVDAEVVEDEQVTTHDHAVGEPVGEEPAEEDPEERARLRRGLMAEATKTFPKDETLLPAAQRARQTAQRHAAAYVALNGVHKSANDMTLNELRRVTRMLRDIQAGAYSVFERDGEWIVAAGDREIVVPAEEG